MSTSVRTTLFVILLGVLINITVTTGVSVRKLASIFSDEVIESELHSFRMDSPRMDSPARRSNGHPDLNNLVFGRRSIWAPNFKLTKEAWICQSVWRWCGRQKTRVDPSGLCQHCRWITHSALVRTVWKLSMNYLQWTLPDCVIIVDELRAVDSPRLCWHCRWITRRWQDMIRFHFGRKCYEPRCNERYINIDRLFSNFSTSA